MTSGYRFPRGLCYRCFVSLALLLSERLLCKCSGTLHACLSLSTIKKSLRHVRQNPQCVPVHDIIYLFCVPFSKCSHPLASLSATKSIKTLQFCCYGTSLGRGSWMISPYIFPRVDASVSTPLPQLSLYFSLMHPLHTLVLGVPGNLDLKG